MLCEHTKGIKLDLGNPRRAWREVTSSILFFGIYSCIQFWFEVFVSNVFLRPRCIHDFLFIYIIHIFARIFWSLDLFFFSINLLEHSEFFQFGNIIVFWFSTVSSSDLFLIFTSVLINQFSFSGSSIILKVHHSGLSAKSIIS